MTKWTKAVPDNELDTAFFNNYFISLTEKECHVLKFKILQFCHVLRKNPYKAMRPGTRTTVIQSYGDGSILDDIP